MAMNKEAFNELIDRLDNVLIFEDGHLIKQTLSDASITIQDKNAPLNALFDNTDDDLRIPADTASTITIKKNHVVEAPIYIIYRGKTTSLNHKTTILLESNAQANVFEYLYNDTISTVNFTSESVIDTNANLTYTSLASMPKDSAAVIKRSAYVKRYGQVTYTNAAFSDAVTKQDNHIILAGEYASGTAKTIALTSDKQETLIKTVVEHKAPKTEGFIEHYGVANDESTLLFEGIGKIHKNMKRSNARQSNKGVVLGDKARLDANPLLLIDEYDVEASHGAAIGQIDEDQLYYLMSRGLSQKDAERLIINGYLAPLNDVLKNDLLKEHVQALLNSKIQ